MLANTPDQVQPRGRRILGHIVAGKITRFADGGGDAVESPFFREEMEQTIRRDVE
jgi:hypothetical protein